ncbi:MAG TPA: MBL fold metallo-hydrolase [Candidatus Saccharimonadales bacterium]|nr:MBL fold metallo-hydrolase [Candidatus Saccharimonadales bacterium]
MIKPLLQGEDFLNDVRNSLGNPDAVSVWWLGQSGFLVQWAGKHLLMDPYLSDSLTVKYAKTDKPHVRMSERVIAPEQLAFIHVVTSSHNHTDHLDAETLRPILKQNPAAALVIPEANRAFVAERLDVAPDFPLGLNAGESLDYQGFKIHAVPAAHNEIEMDSAGRHKFLGYVIQAGRCKIYHSGDTKLYPGMVERLRPWNIDLALLPINGDRPERRVAGNLDGKEAATLAKEIGARLAIPCHYDMFHFNTASTEEFVATAERLRQPCRVLHLGERWCENFSTGSATPR